MTWRTSYRCRLSASAQLWSATLSGCPTRSPPSTLTASLLSLLPTRKIPCWWARFAPCTSSRGWSASQSHRRWLFRLRYFRLSGRPFLWRSCRNRWTYLFGSVIRIAAPDPNSRSTRLCRLICRPLARSRTTAVRRVAEWSSLGSLSSIQVRSRASTLLVISTAWSWWISSGCTLRWSIETRGPFPAAARQTCTRCTLRSLTWDGRAASLAAWG